MIAAKLLPIAALLTMCLSGCWPFSRSELIADYNYRMTVDVETPEGLVSGSAVRNAKRWEITGSMFGYASSQRFSGEAVAVDLPNGETLFLTFSFDRGEEVCDLNHKFRGNRNNVGKCEYDDPEKYKQQTDKLIALKELIEVELPSLGGSDPYFTGERRLLMFRDITDPATVEQVDPENLSASFGKGYALKRVTYQVTNDPVTKGMNERLPWLDELEQGTLVKGDKEKPLLERHPAARVLSSEFKMDFNK